MEKNINKIEEGEFKRLTGVKKGTFRLICKILRVAEKVKKSKGGAPSKLSIPKRVYMWLEYLREYRTYFHCGRSYGVSESSCYKTCVWIENILIKSGQFSLPGKKALLKNNEFEIVLIDVTESPVERPKKNLNLE